ncbi:CHAD domain-containing protein [Algoriphagus sp. CAU 1675]|uniref:CHAD domain-containing protein n=1 Tax=Algoriphagus sp. CAU 1675 TaxID=3032597 RepID=UPI0023DA5134|nr:CHAD domain-containing protein [Algoriphagus sp. CAU 1675]MDF2159147.1 CHAD domain-containing protein [Algoriphagus sp. CAU 1675]
MKTDILNGHLSESLDRLEVYLQEYVENDQEEALHQLRVEIKKIKAVLGFAKEVFEKNYSCFKLKYLFDKAGKIREIQINKQLLEKIGGETSRLFNQLTQRENTLRNQFLKAAPRYVANLHNFKQKLQLPPHLPELYHIQDYFKKKEKKAEELLIQKDREKLHGYRIQIKKMMYVYEFLPSKIQKELNIQPEKINKLQKRLGKWHDTFAAIEFLTELNFKNSNPGIMAHLKIKEQKQFEKFFAD